MRKKRGVGWFLAVALSLLMVPSVAMGEGTAIDVFENTAGDEDSGEGSQSATRVEVVELRRVRVWLRDDSRRRQEPHWLDELIGLPLEEEHPCAGPPRPTERERREQHERRRRSGR